MLKGEFRIEALQSTIKEGEIDLSSRGQCVHQPRIAGIQSWRSSPRPIEPFLLGWHLSSELRRSSETNAISELGKPWIVTQGIEKGLDRYTRHPGAASCVRPLEPFDISVEVASDTKANAIWKAAASLCSRPSRARRSAASAASF